MGWVRVSIMLEYLFVDRSHEHVWLQYRYEVIGQMGALAADTDRVVEHGQEQLMRCIDMNAL